VRGKHMAVAVIDIGSNSIRYMGTSGKQLEITRLASGLNKSGRLSDSAMRHTAEVVRSFVDLAQKEGLPVFAYATSAVRDCLNRKEFLELIRKECGISVDVLSGADEARYAFLGATGGDGGLIDVGGGSSQIITDDCAMSFPMGCVRAKDSVPDVYKTYEAKLAAVYALCSRVYSFPKLPSMRWTAVGGSAHTLAALKLNLDHYECERVDGTALTLSDVKGLTKKLFDMGDARKNLPLLRERHDVILYGAMLLSYMMRGLGVESVAVSYADGLEGYAMHAERELMRRSLPLRAGVHVTRVRPREAAALPTQETAEKARQKELERV
jgi:exopolyphosphatase/guanosine-5'-triphosphate,3'-diphosphate pyrophosphatase